MIKGIDVSDHQGVIDWTKVKSAGIEFAILRCGVGSDIKSQDDKQFERNYSECKRVGIPVGVYLYSYACNIEQAKSEAAHVLRLIEGKVLEYGIWFDMEDADGYKAKRNVSYNTCVDICETFCSSIESKGYYVGIYANLDWLNNKINSNRLDRYDKWVAQWASKCTYNKEYGIWQYRSNGKVDGINGNVDMNYSYKDYPLLTAKEQNKPTEEATKPTENVAPVEKPVDNFILYTIKPGDTLSGIAAKYNTTYQKIAEDNNIQNPNVIYTGDQLKIYTNSKIPEIKIGSKVRYEGYLYRDSYGNGKGQYVSGTYIVTTLIENREYGVNLNNGLGWVKKSLCKVI